MEKGDQLLASITDQRYPQDVQVNTQIPFATRPEKKKLLPPLPSPVLLSYNPNAHEAQVDSHTAEHPLLLQSFARPGTWTVASIQRSKCEHLPFCQLMCNGPSSYLHNKIQTYTF
ncbi:hypothetical protein IFR05_008101 [Cadophora sp. M221]|nr:hypothetical protein IFR05_008101 [Cadophora sp. M221]